MTESSKARKRIAVIGSAGQLGMDIVKQFAASGDYEVLPWARGDVDVTRGDQVESAVTGSRPDVVVNCAALHRVDDCEERVADAFRINAQGAYEVARACNAVHATCVFISTDYVFAGDKGCPYTEDDHASAVNVYGVSKISGEMLVRNVSPNHVILRVSSLFGAAGPRGKGSNFIDAILAKARRAEPLRIVADQWMSPTYTKDAADALFRILLEDRRGVFHGSNAGRCSWYEFALEALQQAGIAALVEPTSAGAYPSKARRPRDSALDRSRPIAPGFTPRPWPEALSSYLAEKGHLPPAAAVP